MKKILFNDHWTYARQSTEFLGTPMQPYQEVMLPHDALIHEDRVKDLPGGKNTGFYPYGSYEYKKEFLYDPEWKGKKLCLLFEGIYTASQVYVNNMLAGSCMNGYLPFTVELDPYLKEGWNEIRIICRCYHDSRWYSGAGIYRDVCLLVSDRIYLPYGKSHVSTKEITSSEAVAEACISVKNETDKTERIELELCISDRKNQFVCRTTRIVTLFPGEERLCRQRLVIADPDLWEPDSPCLYHFCASIPGRDAEEFDFGIRTLSLSKKRGLVLNGHPVKLRGTCIHHDNGLVGACAFKESAFRRIHFLKAAGINAIRMSHHPAGTDILEACDRLGMLVMNEVSDAWTICKNPYDPAFYFNKNWEAIVSGMVQSSINHPSVILYSLGNEIPECGNAVGAQMAWKLSDKIKELDPDRFTILSLNVLFCMMDQRPSQHDSGNAKDINEEMTRSQHVFKSMITTRKAAELVEEAMGYVDIVGYNYGDSRYMLDKNEYPERILCGSETFSNDLAENWKLVSENPQIIGDFNWTGWDYIGETGLGMVEYPSDNNLESWWRLAFCGDYDLIGNRRAQSYYRETVWGLAPHPWILVQNPGHFEKRAEQTPWSFFDGLPVWDYPECEGMNTKIQVYSDADEVELVINHKSFGKKPAGKEVGFITEYTVPYESGIVAVTAYRDHIECGSWQLESGVGNTQLYLVREPSYGPYEEIQYYKIQNMYENGVLDTHTEKLIQIEIRNGELLGFGNSDPKSCEKYDSDRCTLYNGQALAIIRGNPLTKIRLVEI